jgi:hypothetical protein
MAGRHLVAALDRQAVEGFQYAYRVLVRFKNGQSFGAWVPSKMTNAVALQRIFDGYAEYMKVSR